jgi:hypothetical protein
MANICTNQLYLSTKDKPLRDRLMNEITQTFYCVHEQSFDSSIFDCEIEFESRWTFPQNEMKALTKGLSEDNGLYIRVLSIEYGCEYVGFNVYSSGEWCNKFA